MNKEAKYYEGAREDLIKFIKEGTSRILDVGCGVGAAGAAIKKSMGSRVEVVGIELDPDIAEKAKDNIDQVIVGNAEQIMLPFEKGYFDAIIYGDILEHFTDPWSLLKMHGEFLKKGGQVVASIPNVAHYRIIKMLKRQEWDYKNSGVLDRSHYRFFTLKSAKRMFEDAGFRIVEIENKIAASKSRKIINSIFCNRLLDSITEQYIIVAQKRGAILPPTQAGPILF